MSRGTWPLLGDNVCNWQHFSISAAIWFSTGLQETQSTISCSPSIIVIVHSNLGPGRLFYRRIGWQRLKWLLAGCPQVAKAGRRQKRCAVTMAHRWRAVRQRTPLKSLSLSSPFWKFTRTLFRRTPPRYGSVRDNLRNLPKYELLVLNLVLLWYGIYPRRRIDIISWLKMAFLAIFHQKP